MYQGKHIPRDSRRAPRKNRRFRWNRQFVLLVSILALLVGIVGSSLAYLITQTGSVENTFQPSKVTCEIQEDFSQGGSEKKNVQVKNTGDTDAYIRATYVVNWLDSAGNIVASVPEGYSYTLSENPDNTWTKGEDGYFYYLTPVAPGDSTPESLLNCKVTYPENPEYRLSVEILATAIQSMPAKAVTEAWGVTPPSGN